MIRNPTVGRTTPPGVRRPLLAFGFFDRLAMPPPDTPVCLKQPNMIPLNDGGRKA
jgi:hypothetical protein